jgi:alkanesulfonate monooxygenase SsuD/methylene tetrahydromethanopterin reductase-like flavin-dependent oxidoreductase (luciferase family)
MIKGLGLSLPNRGVLFGATTVGQLQRMVDVADSSGMFHSVWVGDGLIAKPRVEAVTFLATLAGRTQAVRLGVCCLATFPLRNPVLFACQWASLDVLSDGRALLAVCLGAPTGRGGGDFAAELEAMGIRGNERVGRLEEGIEVLRLLWRERGGYQGRYWSFPEIDLQPKPLQQPCPIWIASNPNPEKLSPDRYAAAIDRVGRLADGWQSTVVTPQEFGRRWNEIREAARRHDRDPDTMTSSAHLMINLNDDVESARAAAKHFLDDYYTTDVKPATMDAWGAYGSVEMVVKRIQEYISNGLELPVLRFATFEQEAQLQVAMDELVPQLLATRQPQLEAQLPQSGRRNG